MRSTVAGVTHALDFLELNGAEVGHEPFATRKDDRQAMRGSAANRSQQRPFSCNINASATWGGVRKPSAPRGAYAGRAVTHLRRTTMNNRALCTAE